MCVSQSRSELAEGASTDRSGVVAARELYPSKHLGLGGLGSTESGPLNLFIRERYPENSTLAIETHTRSILKLSVSSNGSVGNEMQGVISNSSDDSSSGAGEEMSNLAEIAG